MYAACLVTQSCPTLCNPWTIAHQATLSMGFSKQEYWSGLPFPSPGDLPRPEIKPLSPALEGRFLTTELYGKRKLRKFQLFTCLIYRNLEYWWEVRLLDELLSS